MHPEPEVILGSVIAYSNMFILEGLAKFTVALYPIK